MNKSKEEFQIDLLIPHIIKGYEKIIKEEDFKGFSCNRIATYLNDTNPLKDSSYTSFLYDLTSSVLPEGSHRLYPFGDVGLLDTPENVALRKEFCELVLANLKSEKFTVELSKRNTCTLIVKLIKNPKYKEPVKKVTKGLTPNNVRTELLWFLTHIDKNLDMLVLDWRYIGDHLGSVFSENLRFFFTKEVLESSPDSHLYWRKYDGEISTETPFRTKESGLYPDNELSERFLKVCIENLESGKFGIGIANTEYTAKYVKLVVHPDYKEPVKEPVKETTKETTKKVTEEGTKEVTTENVKKEVLDFAKYISRNLDMLVFSYQGVSGHIHRVFKKYINFSISEAALHSIAHFGFQEQDDNHCVNRRLNERCLNLLIANLESGKLDVSINCRAVTVIVNPKHKEPFTAMKDLIKELVIEGYETLIDANRFKTYSCVLIANHVMSVLKEQYAMSTDVTFRLTKEVLPEDLDVRYPFGYNTCKSTHENVDLRTKFCKEALANLKSGKFDISIGVKEGEITPVYLVKNSKYKEPAVKKPKSTDVFNISPKTLPTYKAVQYTGDNLNTVFDFIHNEFSELNAEIRRHRSNILYLTITDEYKNNYSVDLIPENFIVSFYNTKIPSDFSEGFPIVSMDKEEFNTYYKVV